MKRARSLWILCAAALASPPAMGQDNSPAGSPHTAVLVGSARATGGVSAVVARKDEPAAERKPESAPKPAPESATDPFQDDEPWPGDCCCRPEYWEHRGGVYGEYILLRAAGDDVAHGFQRNGTVPVGRVGTVDQEYESGFRLGMSGALDRCASWGASYLRVDSHGTDSLDAPAGVGGETASLVLHPGFVNAGTASALLGATHDVDLQIVDVEYRHLYAGGCDYAVDYLVGLRYGNVEQNFSQLGTFAQPSGDLLTLTDIDFDGVGLRAGLSGRRRMRGGWSMYAKGSINVLLGDVKADFVNVNLTTDTILAQAGWEDTRVVPVLDYELGMTWTNCADRWSMSIGYYASIWFNAVTTSEFIRAAQSDSFVDLGDTIAFEGLTARIEYRF